MAVRRMIHRDLIVFVSHINRLNERALYLIMNSLWPLFLIEQTSRLKLMKKVQMQRNRGRRPGAVLQPENRGIFKDQRAIPRLNPIRRIALKKSIPAMLSFSEPCCSVRFFVSILLVSQRR